MNKLLMVVLDGCSPEYISRENTPNFYRMAKNGFCRSVKAVVPPIHEVNHATIITGEFPAKHGIFTSDENYKLDSGSVESVFQFYNKIGKSTALITTKKAMLNDFAEGLKFGICTEIPNEILVRFLDLEMPSVDSMEENLWVMEATHNLLKKNNPDLVYCALNSFVFENHKPESKEALEFMNKIDGWLGKIFDLDLSREIYITADHGVKKYASLIDFNEVIQKHQDLFSGTSFEVEGGWVFLSIGKNSKDQEDKLMEVLEKEDCIEQIYTSEEAAETYRMPLDRMGDYTILPKRGKTFGFAYEREVPLIAVNPRETPQKYRYSRDIVKIIKEKESGNC